MGSNSSQLRPAVEIEYSVEEDKKQKNQKKSKAKTYKKKYKPKKPKKKVAIQNIGEQENTNFFLFRACCTPEVNYQDWLEHFEKECNEQQDKQWAQDMLQRIHLFSGYPAQYYQKEIQWIYYAYLDSNNYGRTNYQPSIIKSALENDQTMQFSVIRNSFQGNENLNKSSYIQEQDTSVDEDNNNEETDKKLKRKLYKESCLIEEDQELEQFQSGNIQKFFNGVKESTVSQNVPSFIYQYNQTARKEDPTSNTYLKQLNLYCSIMRVIKKHISDGNCILNFILREFYKSFIPYYREKVKDLQKLQKGSQNQKTIKEQQEIVDQGVSDLQQFIRIYQETIVYFYNLGNKDLKKQVPLFTRDNVLNFITSTVFDNADLYNVMFNLQKNLDIEEYDNLKNIMESGLLLSEDDFLIPDKFQLNNKTYNYLLRKDMIQEKRDLKTYDNLEIELSTNNNNSNSKKNKFLSRIKGSTEYSINNERGNSYISVHNEENSNQLSYEEQEEQIDHTFGMNTNIEQESGNQSQGIFKFGQKSQLSQSKQSEQGQDPQFQQQQNKKDIQNLSQNSKQQTKFKDIYNVMHLFKNASNQKIDSKMYRKSEYNEKKLQESYDILSEMKKSKNSKMKQEILFLVVKMEPYQECIKQLMKIETRINPVSKLRIILKASELLIKLIDKFYEYYGAKFNKSIDSDDLVSIFNYIVLKSNLPSLVTHCKIIEKFSTNTILNSVSGFYLTTVQASLDYLNKNIDTQFINECKQNVLKEENK